MTWSPIWRGLQISTPQESSSSGEPATPRANPLDLEPLDIFHMWECPKIVLMKSAPRSFPAHRGFFLANGTMQEFSTHQNTICGDRNSDPGGWWWKRNKFIDNGVFYGYNADRASSQLHAKIAATLRG